MLIIDNDKVHRFDAGKDIGERGELMMGQIDDIKCAVRQYMKYKSMWLNMNKRDDTLKRMMVNEMSHIQYHVCCFMDMLKGSKDCEDESAIYSQMASAIK